MGMPYTIEQAGGRAYKRYGGDGPAFLATPEEAQVWEHVQELAKKLREKSDRITELEKNVATPDSQVPQVAKPARR